MLVPLIYFELVKIFHSHLLYWQFIRCNIISCLLLNWTLYIRQTFLLWTVYGTQDLCVILVLKFENLISRIYYQQHRFFATNGKTNWNFVGIKKEKYLFMESQSNIKIMCSATERTREKSEKLWKFGNIYTDDDLMMIVQQK